MEAPTIGGMRVRKGNGETVRLPRGASLTDFAEKINVDAAALVQMLFSLGEMVTSTQSVGDETFELLAEELNYVVQIVSPEDEDRERSRTPPARSSPTCRPCTSSAGSSPRSTCRGGSCAGCATSSSTPAP